MDSKTFLRIAARAAAGLVLSAVGAQSAAGQTLQLTQSNATVLRGGTYADMNLSSDLVLSTRASSDATYVRRIVLKFDTETPLPAGTPISSAILTLTVAGGNAEARTLAAYRVKSSYEATQTTWNRRNTTTAWTSAGGDLAERYATVPVTNAVGSRLAIDVTALVQASVKGTFGSRYSRIALVDQGSSTKESYKEYFSERAADVSTRPLLTVVYGSAPAPVPPPTSTQAPPPTGGVQLRVLQYNTHHGGYGTDGRYDPDRLATWMAKMKPDVITLNEVEKFTGWGNEDQPARYKALMEAKTGRKWYMVFAQEFGAWTSNGKGHVILSTYPLESTMFYDMSWDRVAAAARITVNGRTISLVVTHLDPDSLSRRLTQAQQVMGWASAVPENRILTGDMNAWPDQSSIAEYDKAYSDSWAVAESAGKAVGFAGLSPSGATKNGRIDYIFYSKKSTNLAVVGSQVYDTRDTHGVMPSDHRPVLTTFEVR
jgi:endonuclease/exonuclease/phosphatase family metal-dependent hydrolase